MSPWRRAAATSARQTATRATASSISTGEELLGVRHLGDRPKAGLVPGDGLSVGVLCGFSAGWESPRHSQRGFQDRPDPGVLGLQPCRS